MREFFDEDAQREDCTRLMLIGATDSAARGLKTAVVVGRGVVCGAKKHANGAFEVLRSEARCPRRGARARTLPVGGRSHIAEAAHCP